MRKTALVSMIAFALTLSIVASPAWAGAEAGVHDGSFSSGLDEFVASLIQPAATRSY